MKTVLIVLGALVLLGIVVALIAMALGSAARRTATRTFDAIFTPDASGRYPGEAGWVDSGA